MLFWAFLIAFGVKVSLVLSTPSYQYVGCFIDDPLRDLPYRHWTDNNMTTQICYYHCQDYQYFSTQYGKHCFCGDTYGQFGEDDNGCYMPCSGDPATKCGDSWRNSIYQIYPDEIEFTYIGCYKSIYIRDISHAAWSYNKMTVSLCAKHCSDYKYFSLQDAIRCTCGNYYDPALRNSSDCSLPCSENKDEGCGALHEIQTTVSVQVEYVGCYKDSLTYPALPNRFWSYVDLTVNQCASHCKGYSYMGIQNGKYCYCGMTYGKHGEDLEGCGIPCAGNYSQLLCGGRLSNAVYRIKEIKVNEEPEYMGCYIDDTPQKLTEREWNYDYINYELCAQHCTGYTYMGLLAGRQCSCGDSYGSYDGNVEGCDTPCAGDQGLKCGDGWHKSVFQLPFDEVKYPKYIGCFKDTARRDLAQRMWKSSDMTYAACALHCIGYKYMGLQFSSYCFCGNSHGKYGSDYDGCQMPCSGNSTEVCGDGWRNSVFELKEVSSLESLLEYYTHLYPNFIY